MSKEDDYREARDLFESKIRDSTTLSSEVKEKAQTIVDRLKREADWERECIRQQQESYIPYHDTPEAFASRMFVRIITHPISLCLFTLAMIQLGIEKYLAFWKANPCTGTFLTLFIAEIVTAIVWIYRTFLPEERSYLVLAIILSFAAIIGLLFLAPPILFFSLVPLFFVCRKPAFKSALGHFRDLENKLAIIGVFGITLLALTICFLF